MIEQQFERTARAWLELGPSQAPVGAVEAALTAIETVPQVRRASGRSSRRFVYLAAAAGLAAALGAALMIGTQQPQPPTPTPRPSAPVSSRTSPHSPQPNRRPRSGSSAASDRRTRPSRARAARAGSSSDPCGWFTATS